MLVYLCLIVLLSALKVFHACLFALMAVYALPKQLILLQTHIHGRHNLR